MPIFNIQNNKAEKIPTSKVGPEKDIQFLIEDHNIDENTADQNPNSDVVSRLPHLYSDLRAYFRNTPNR